MGFIDKLKDMISTPEEEYDDEYREDPSLELLAKNERPEREDPLASRRDNKVVNIHATTQLQVVLVKPERFDDASGVADHLIEKRTVVLNLESTNRDISRRLVDFLSGVAYANGGQIKRVANNTFIITPYNVNVVGDLIDELESSGVFF